MDDFVNTPRGNANRVRELVLANLQRFQKLFKEHFPGMCGRKISFFHLVASVIIDNLDVKGVPILPDEAHRHWSCTRMLCCPFLLPFSASRWLPGGTRSVSRTVAASICSSLRAASR